MNAIASSLLKSMLPVISTLSFLILDLAVLSSSHDLFGMDSPSPPLSPKLRERGGEGTLQCARFFRQYSNTLCSASIAKYKSVLYFLA
jgi:hypothetical protein